MQTKLGSAVETVTNIGVGYVISLLLTLTVLPLFGYDVGLQQGVGISVIFTVASILRSYILRIMDRIVRVTPHLNVKQMTELLDDVWNYYNTMFVLTDPDTVI